MNKAAVIASQIAPAPAGYDLERFSDLVAQLDSAILDGRISAPFVLGGLQSILDGGLLSRNFPVWKTLKRSHLERRFTDYAYKLRDAGCMKRGNLGAFFGAEEVYQGDLDVDIVRVSSVDLGFFQKLNIRRSTLYERAIALGLELPWPEVGFALRLEYLDQPEGEWLTLATRLVDPEIPDHMMRLGHTPYEKGCDGISGILGIEVIPGEKFVRCDEEFVFIKPRTLAL